ncbi:MAG: helix-turn-helix domain-containing protein [Candidatus Anammoxibacter sp.]
MNYKIGYIASRVGVPSKSDQRARLISYGVDDNDIYENLDDCLGSLRQGDELIVYTVAIFGRNKLNDVFMRANDAMIHGIYTSRKPYLYKFGLDNMRLLSDAWEELNSLSKRVVGAIGREKGGRKPGKAWDKAEAIRSSYNEGMPLDELAGVHGVSTSTIRRVIDSYEGKE